MTTHDDSFPRDTKNRRLTPSGLIVAENEDGGVAGVMMLAAAAVSITLSVMIVVLTSSVLGLLPLAGIPTAVVFYVWHEILVARRAEADVRAHGYDDLAAYLEAADRHDHARDLGFLGRDEAERALALISQERQQ